MLRNLHFLLRCSFVWRVCYFMVPQSCPLLCPHVSPRVSCCPRGACPHVALLHLSTQAWHLSHITSGKFHQKCRFIWNFYKPVLFIASDSPCIPSSSTGQMEMKRFMKFPFFKTGKLAAIWLRSESESLSGWPCDPLEEEGRLRVCL